MSVNGCSSQYVSPEMNWRLGLPLPDVGISGSKLTDGCSVLGNENLNFFKVKYSSDDLLLLMLACLEIY